MEIQDGRHFFLNCTRGYLQFGMLLAMVSVVWYSFITRQYGSTSKSEQSINLVAKRTSGRCHTRQNVRNNIKSKRIHNISFPQFRAMVNMCSADGDRVCCDEALVMRHWEHRVGRPLSASRILVNPVLV